MCGCHEGSGNRNKLKRTNHEHTPGSLSDPPVHPWDRVGGVEGGGPCHQADGALKKAPKILEN